MQNFACDDVAAICTVPGCTYHVRLCYHEPTLCFRCIASEPHSCDDSAPALEEEEDGSPPPTKKLAWFDEGDEGSDDEESDKEGGAEGGPRKRKREKARKKNDWNKDKRCAYRAVDLAPLIIEKLVAQPNLSTKAIIEELYPAYLQFQPSGKFVSKVRLAAIKATAKQETQGHTKIEYLLSLHTELEKLGFKVDAVVTHLQRMEEIIMETAQGEHEEAQAELDEGERTAFAGLPDAVQCQLEALRTEDAAKHAAGGVGLEFYQGHCRACGEPKKGHVCLVKAGPLKAAAQED